jgi:hypothetical protein
MFWDLVGAWMFVHIGLPILFIVFLFLVSVVWFFINYCFQKGKGKIDGI